MYIQDWGSVLLFWYFFTYFLTQKYRLIFSLYWGYYDYKLSFHKFWPGGKPDSYFPGFSGFGVPNRLFRSVLSACELALAWRFPVLPGRARRGLFSDAWKRFFTTCRRITRRKSPCARSLTQSASVRKNVNVFSNGWLASRFSSISLNTGSKKARSFWTTPAYLSRKLPKAPALQHKATILPVSNAWPDVHRGRIVSGKFLL